MPQRGRRAYLACERLIQQVLGKDVATDAVVRAVEQSAGNALYLEELIRLIAEGKSADQPETVLAMLQARISRLDAGSRRALRAAAVFGQTFWQGGVAAILGLPNVEEWLRSATNAELVQPHRSSRLANETEYDFRHALVREAAYGLLTPSDKTTGHRLAAEFLVAAGEVEVAVIAEHFESGGQLVLAADHYLRAAERCLERHSNLPAKGHVEKDPGCDRAGETS